MTDDVTSEIEDEREVELSSICAIFPEITLDSLDPFKAFLDIPVYPSVPLPVFFQKSPAAAPVTAPGAKESEKRPDIHLLTHLPTLHLQIALPEGYPTSLPPSFRLSTTPRWLPRALIDQFESDGQRLWKESGHDQIVFAYIDHLQQAAENVFGVLGDKDCLEVQQDLKISLLDFDIKAKRAAFEKETFNCGVCLDPKKGSACHRLLDCGHVFCRQCLQDFYNNAISEGDLSLIRCLMPDYAKARSIAEDSRTGKRRKPKTRISPSELLQIPLEHDVVKRYVTLKHKMDLESDKNTIYCPRKWCQGAARSKAHHKPSQLLEVYESSDESEDENESTDSNTSSKAWSDFLAICEDCSFAFCSRCNQGWHGEFTFCIPRTTNEKLTEEDRASLEYIQLHSTPCPTCATRAQKIQGCNHMICIRCNTHFCYLCAAWLEPGNPYKHYNLRTTSCFMRLWELLDGDGNDVGIGYAGGAQPRPDAVQDHHANVHHHAAEPGVLQHPAPGVAAVDAEEPAPNAQIVAAPAAPAVAREGPLVLRIGQLPPRAAPDPQAAPPPQPGPRPHHRAGWQGAPAEGRLAGGRHGVAAGARRQANQPAQVPRPQPLRRAPGAAAEGGAAPAANGLDAANQLWIDNFVRMALADEEDLVDWDSDDEEDIGAWQIPVR